MSQLNGTLTSTHLPNETWTNLLVALKLYGYTGRSALVQLMLAPAGAIRVKRNSTNATAPVSATDGILVGTGGPGATYEWNHTRQGGFLEASQTWIYGDGGDVVFDLTGGEF